MIEPIPGQMTVDEVIALVELEKAGLNPDPAQTCIRGNDDLWSCSCEERCADAGRCLERAGYDTEDTPSLSRVMFR